MLDDLRNSAASSYLEDEPTPETPEPSPAKKKKKEDARFLGLTAPQRFIVVLLLMMMTCLLGTFVLILTGKVWLPIG
ncbi:MAG: hypothetical protein RBT34_05145 [Anaerolineaceae bacterium]|jgi:hypothetical protein|nr:hypothetical protein [Anaerolineaceae bacterium]